MVIEANACGIPVITIDHKDNVAKDLIEEGRNGFVYQLDEHEIAKKLLRLLKKHPDKKMKQICKDSGREYDWDRIVSKVEEVYLR